MLNRAHLKAKNFSRTIITARLTAPVDGDVLKEN